MHNYLSEYLANPCQSKPIKFDLTKITRESWAFHQWYNPSTACHSRWSVYVRINSTHQTSTSNIYSRVPICMLTVHNIIHVYVSVSCHILVLTTAIKMLLRFHTECTIFVQWDHSGVQTHNVYLRWLLQAQLILTIVNNLHGFIAATKPAAEFFFWQLTQYCTIQFYELLQEMVSHINE